MEQRSGEARRVTHYFVEPHQLNLAVSIAEWREDPWYRRTRVECYLCDFVLDLILVSTKIVDNSTCDGFLEADLARRGWAASGGIDICPGCRRNDG